MARKADSGRAALDALRARLNGARVPGPSDAVVPQERPAGGWTEEEREHHRIERAIWKASLVLSAIIFAGALASAGFTYWGASEAKRQADIAQDNLIATTRAWLQFDSEPTLTFYAFNPRGKNGASHSQIQTVGEPIAIPFVRDAGFYLDYRLSLKSYGSSPATKVQAYAEYRDDNHIPSNSGEVQCSRQDVSYLKVGSIAPQETVSEGVRVDEVPLGKNLASSAEGAGNYELGGVIVFCITYNVLGSSSVHHLVRVYQIGRKQQWGSRGVLYTAALKSSEISNLSDVELIRLFGPEWTD